MPRPANCPHNLYQMMRACWATRAEQRPTFTTLEKMLDDFFMADDTLTEYADPDGVGSLLTHSFL